MFKIWLKSMIHAVLTTCIALIPGFINGDLSFLTWDFWIYITLCIHSVFFMQIYWRDGK